MARVLAGWVGDRLRLHLLALAARELCLSRGGRGSVEALGGEDLRLASLTHLQDDVLRFPRRQVLHLHAHQRHFRFHRLLASSKWCGRRGWY